MAGRIASAFVSGSRWIRDRALDAIGLPHTLTLAFALSAAAVASTVFAPFPSRMQELVELTSKREAEEEDSEFSEATLGLRHRLRKASADRCV